MGCEVLSEAVDPHSPETLRAVFAAHGQGQVFRFWDALDAAARRRLIEQAASFDLPVLRQAFEATRAAAPAAARPSTATRPAST